MGRAGESRSLWLPLLVLALNAGAMEAYRIDDSFISFRYAKNLVDGHGLVFNAGERVEGYTNFLWVIALAAGKSLGADVERASVLLGILSMLAAVILTHRLARASSDGRDGAALAATLLAASSPFVFWAFSGMETSAFTALLVGAALAVVRTMRHEGSAVAAGVVLAAACLVRPDAAIATAISFVMLWLYGGPGRTRRAFLLAATVIVVLVPYAAWKLAFYGTLLPNTFHAKVGQSVAQAIRGASYVASFLAFAAAAGCLPAAFFGIRANGAHLYLGALVVSQIAYVTFVGGDSFPFYRFLVPVLPFLCVLAALGLHRIREALPAEAAPEWLWRAAILVALLLAAGMVHQGSNRRMIHDKAAINERYRAVGLWLNRNSTPSDAIAVIAAGIIPYYSERPAIDMLGLTDAHIARRPVASMGSGMAGHEKGDGRYVLSRRPRFILLHPVTTRKPATLEQIATRSRAFLTGRELLADPDFERLYELRSASLGDFYFNYFGLR